MLSITHMCVLDRERKKKPKSFRKIFLLFFFFYVWHFLYNAIFTFHFIILDKPFSYCINLVYASWVSNVQNI